MAHIRDPIHGVIEISDQERVLIDDPYFQRLRGIRQLGFGEFAFPGATHSRYSHSIGAMQIAARVCDQALRNTELGPAEKARMRQAVRLAVLFHDIGHAPLSHTSESTMPLTSTLRLPPWVLARAEPGASQATHEHYTLGILLTSSLADALRHTLDGTGLTPEAIASLIAGVSAPGSSPFIARGINYFPLLSQIVSGELDADRMDYLLRDSFYTGVAYGKYDLGWLLENMTNVVVDGAAYLALNKRAIFTFEDFLLSRYHMFLAVYYHYTSTGFDHMLLSYYRDERGAYELPSDFEAYLTRDDTHLWSHLRASQSPWAKAITSRHPWPLLIEANEFDSDYDVAGVEAALAESGARYFTTESTSTLSKYFRKKDSIPLYLLDPQIDRLKPIDRYTPLYEQFNRPMKIRRIYISMDDRDRGRAIIRKYLGGSGARA